MRRRGVELVVQLLDVLAVVAFAVGQPEESLFEDRVLAVPKREAQAEPLLVVTETGDSILAPAIGPTTGMIVWEVIPRGAIGTVVLANGAPLAVAEVGAPFSPVGSACSVGIQPLLFCVHRHA